MSKHAPGAMFIAHVQAALALLPELSWSEDAEREADDCLQQALEISGVDGPPSRVVDRAARLLGAAPDMAEALRKVTNLLNSIVPAGDELDQPIEDAVAEAHAALKKAGVEL